MQLTYDEIKSIISALMYTNVQNVLGNESSKSIIIKKLASLLTYMEYYELEAIEIDKKPIVEQNKKSSTES